MTYGQADGYITSFSNSGEKLWFTYFGGVGYDDCLGVAAFNNSTVVVVGTTTSETGFPINIPFPNSSCCSSSHSSVSGKDGFIAQFNVTNLIGIDELAVHVPTLRLYPNPTIDILNIELYGNNNGNIVLEVYEINGKLVMSKNEKMNTGNNTWSINTEKLNSGAYFVRFCSDKATTNMIVPIVRTDC